jgi:hypothetical protein
MALLTQLLEDAGTGQLRVGEPGIGKTRLAREFVADAGGVELELVSRSTAHCAGFDPKCASTCRSHCSRPLTSN